MKILDIIKSPLYEVGVAGGAARIALKDLPKFARVDLIDQVAIYIIASRKNGQIADTALFIRRKFPYFTPEEIAVVEKAAVKKAFKIEKDFRVYLIDQVAKYIIDARKNGQIVDTALFIRQKFPNLTPEEIAAVETAAAKKAAKIEKDLNKGATSSARVATSEKIAELKAGWEEFWKDVDFIVKILMGIGCVANIEEAIRRFYNNMKNATAWLEQKDPEHNEAWYREVEKNELSILVTSIVSSIVMTTPAAKNILKTLGLWIPGFSSLVARVGQLAIINFMWTPAGKEWLANIALWRLSDDNKFAPILDKLGLRPDIAELVGGNIQKYVYSKFPETGSTPTASATDGTSQTANNKTQATPDDKTQATPATAKLPDGSLPAKRSDWRDWRDIGNGYIKDPLTGEIALKSELPNDILNKLRGSL